ncbi:unnamed protein product [Rotaria sp. Silwood2]|nr:unnamed protein product [Rotaria sp. Silwood2]CAF3005737.1 unnamed protein product [Rotaria sp. Silwood2]CAF3329764.1 unnamed protein product [Rotaria sp. Silwood2]CAF4515734.1 unnamed protein product [Rotaria sp. Silwood2]CAF4535608.1 unnamed protein product [Rotaria sp. Silwood2]
MLTYIRSTCLLMLLYLTQTNGLNVLVISLGLGGHVTPLFELAKAMQNHNVTFLTGKLAQSYINFDGFTSSSFRVIYSNDSSNALLVERSREQELLSVVATRSILDCMPIILTAFADMISPILNKTIHTLMNERFDVIVSSTVIVGVPILCEKMSIPCVIHNPGAFPSILDFNLPNIFSLTTTKDLTQLSSRLYNVAFTLRMTIRLLPKIVPVLYSLIPSLPRVPGPFYDTFTVRSLLFSKTKCLHLISMPMRFFVPNYSNYYLKYLGAFMDVTRIDGQDTDLNRWVKSKPSKSIIYGAFGSTSLITYNRMRNLIIGLADFLLQTNDTVLLLALRSTNFNMYQVVVKDLYDDELRSILHDKYRVRIEEGFVQQKWILQQDSVKIFLSHCGMGSLVESLYFGKPVVCMPFNMEQFANAITVVNLDVGKSLFIPPSPWRSLINPYNFVNYTFISASVTNNVMALWMNETHEKAVMFMSLEMKYAGGTKRAVQEIEFFVALNGDLDRFAPFHSTLPLYQRCMLDLLLICVVLPITMLLFLIRRCCKNSPKQKRD